MKRSSIALIVFFVAIILSQGFFSVSNQTKAQSAIALIAHASASATCCAVAATPPLNTTGATLLVAVVTVYFGSSVQTTVSDSLGNTWTPLTNYSGGNANVTIWYAKNPVVGPSQTFSGSGKTMSIFVSAWSGITNAAPFDLQNGAGTAVVGNTIQPGTITPSGSNELIISAA